jgi:hypothetical protein
MDLVEIEGETNPMAQVGTLLGYLTANWDPRDDQWHTTLLRKDTTFQLEDNRQAGIFVEGRSEPVGYSQYPAWWFLAENNWTYVRKCYLQFDAANCGRSVIVGPGEAYPNNSHADRIWRFLSALILQNSMQKLKQAGCNQEKEFIITWAERKRHWTERGPGSGSFSAEDQHVLDQMFEIWREEAQGQGAWLLTLKVCSGVASQALFGYLDSLGGFNYSIEFLEHWYTEKMVFIRDWMNGATFNQHKGLKRITIVVWLTGFGDLDDPDADSEESSDEETQVAEERQKRDSLIKEMARICNKRKVEFVMEQVGEAPNTYPRY